MVPNNSRTWSGSCTPVYIAGVSSPNLRHRFHSIAHTSTSYSGRLIVRAEKRPSSRKTRQVSGKRDSGFFADVDPNGALLCIYLNYIVQY